MDAPGLRIFQHPMPGVCAPVPQDALLWTFWGVLLKSDCYLTVSVYTFDQRSVSSRLSLAMSSGLPPAAIRLSSRKRALVSGSAMMSLIARLSLAMMAGAVLGGALIAFQVSETKPATPASIMVGMAGS